jgi:serine/threonine-protein kinase
LGSQTESPIRPIEIAGYRVLGHLGDGAGSTLYVVSEPRTRRLWALKHVVIDSEQDERYLRQLETEHEIGTKADHPGIRSVHRIVRHRRRLRVSEASLLMEFVDGPCLADAPFRTIGTAVATFQRVARALEHLHAIGYVHADIKPGNVLIAADGSIKIIDLGQGCRPGTVKARIQGTPDFMAPEQQQRGPVTEQTDIYNLGATMYRMLTRRGVGMPRGDGEVSVPSPHEIDERIHPLLSRQVMDCLRANPEERPPSMGVVANRLSTLESVVQIPERPSVIAPRAAS